MYALVEEGLKEQGSEFNQSVVADQVKSPSHPAHRAVGLSVGSMPLTASSTKTTPILSSTIPMPTMTTNITPPSIQRPLLSLPLPRLSSITSSNNINTTNSSRLNNSN